MFNLIKPQSIFLRNCLIVYLIVGCLASILAESHQSFRQSSQSINAHNFSRVISLGLAYNARQSLYSD